MKLEVCINGQQACESGEVLFYSDGSGKEFLSVVFKDETFWLTQKAMAELYDVNVPAISKHLQNIYDEEELDRASTLSKMETVQDEGGRRVRRTLDFYNMGAIIAVGYWVNSKKAASVYEEFRKKQDADYISEFDRQTAKYLKGETMPGTNSGSPR